MHDCCLAATLHFGKKFFVSFVSFVSFVFDVRTSAKQLDPSFARLKLPVDVRVRFDMRA